MFICAYGSENSQQYFVSFDFYFSPPGVSLQKHTEKGMVGSALKEGACIISYSI